MPLKALIGKRHLRHFILAWATVAAVVLFAGSLYVAVSSNRNLATAIQQSRQEITVTRCLDLNARHDATIAKLDQEIGALPPVERKQAKTNRAGTVALIDALAPKRNCQSEGAKVRLK